MDYAHVSKVGIYAAVMFSGGIALLALFHTYGLNFIYGAVFGSALIAIGLRIKAAIKEGQK